MTYISEIYDIIKIIKTDAKKTHGGSGVGSTLTLSPKPAREHCRGSCTYNIIPHPR